MTEYRKLNKWRHRKKNFKTTRYRREREELKNRDRESDRGRQKEILKSSRLQETQERIKK